MCNIYAPVLIPTLNRYEHFKRCLESLEKCTGADKTDVFVALDYPPSEKYLEGWKKIDIYLAEKELSNSFNNLFVDRRERTFGVGHSNSNLNVLIRDVVKNYDRYIFSEDDNEFSPCFLEFMNKSLERFKGDNSILKVCGYNYLQEDLPSDYKANYFFSKRGSAWGTGNWVKKDVLLSKYYDLDFLKGLLQDDVIYQMFREKNPQCISYIRAMLKKKQLYGDSIWEIYCAINDAKFVLPRTSATRNHGFDGSGWHSNHLENSLFKYYSEKEIDTNTYFDFIDDDNILEYKYESDHSFERGFRRYYKKMVKIIDVFLIRKFNFVPTSKYI
ncbi:MAG: glycosyltransferase family 2 protein [Paludibacteraceae bacterium]|nr:glycosyltransferase family 2 protein [Paludibacteraceae bacterium]